MSFAVRIGAVGAGVRFEQDGHGGLVTGAILIPGVGSKKFGSTCANIGGEDKSRLVGVGMHRSMFMFQAAGSNVDGGDMEGKFIEASCSLDN